eukprot:TRINITY_DN579_c0_g1_i1.p1 TRINITY_DN579_c0_g1~~TRINITY_DN579_c0_g1_i1.p1  ORF type:complete len:884 (-),score=172.09 TRINITY_DN579_c0_g1_i1:30-2681(-)
MAGLNYQGYMNKKGGAFGTSYQKRYFILSGSTLTYFKDKGKEEVGAIDLKGATITNEPAPKFALSIEGPLVKKKYELTCLTDAEKREWMSQLERASLAGQEAQFDEPPPAAAEPTKTKEVEAPAAAAAPAAPAAAAAATSPAGADKKREERKEVKPGAEVWVTKTLLPDGGVDFYVENLSQDKVTLKINLTATKNVRVQAYEAVIDDGMAIVVMDPEETKHAVALFRENPKEPVSNRVGYVFTKEDPSPEYLAKQRDRAYDRINQEIAAIEAITTPEERKDMELVAAKCKQAGIPFVDLEFPPQKFDLPQFIWMRPKEFLDPAEGEPQLFDDCIEPNDIFQGSLGDCWFMCGLATMAEFPDVIRRCLPEKPLDSKVGCYRMRICKDGWWRVVTVDDYFPCNLGRGPAYAKNKGAELWSAISEKAYAKLHGSFAAMGTGLTGQALAELTGFPYKKFGIRGKGYDTEELWRNLRIWDKSDFMMSAGTPGDGTAEYGGDGEEDSKPLFTEDEYYQAGFIMAHSYSVIDTAEPAGTPYRLLKCRNPWGGLEWNGDWSDNSELWTDAIRDELQFEAADDGLFWMSFEDFLKYFVNVTVCFNHIHSDWRDLRARGEFVNAQPSFTVELTVLKPCKAFFSISQKDKRGKAADDPEWDYYDVGFVVLKPVAGSNDYAVLEWTGLFRSRDVWRQLELETSDRPIVIIPMSSTRSPKNFSLSLLLSEPEFGKVEFKKYEPVFLDKAVRIGTLSNGKERVWSEENKASIFTYTVGRWLGMLAVNRGDDKNWNIRINCEASKGYRSLSDDGTLKFEVHVPRNSMRYVGTFIAESTTSLFEYQVQHQFSKKGDEPDPQGISVPWDVITPPVEVAAQVDGNKHDSYEEIHVSKLSFV